MKNKVIRIVRVIIQRMFFVHCLCVVCGLCLIWCMYICVCSTLTVLVMTIDALGHFETG